MLDKYFLDLKDNIQELKKDIKILKDIVAPEQELFSVKDLSKRTGIPYNTLISSKDLLPSANECIKIGKKRYYPKDIVHQWLRSIIKRE